MEGSCDTVSPSGSSFKGANGHISNSPSSGSGVHQRVSFREAISVMPIPCKDAEKNHWDTVMDFGNGCRHRMSSWSSKSRASRASTKEGKATRRSSTSKYSWYQRGSDGQDSKTDHVATHRKSVEGGPQTLFADANAMKGALYENIDKKDYDVANFYKTTGCAQKIARSDVFGMGTLLVICINAIWIGVDSDHNKATNPQEAKLHFQIADQLFCFFFSFELAVRFAAFERKWNCLRDNWFKFDSTLVFLMVFETWILPMIGAAAGGGSMGNLSLLKILRLLRLTRMVRIMRAMPALMTMLKGMSAGFRSVGATCSLLLIFLYVFAIIFQQEHKYHPSEDLRMWFGTIPLAMWTLLLSGTFLDNLTQISNTFRDEGSPVYTAVFLFFVAISALTIINMLIGVLCEVVSAVASAEKEKAVVTYVKGQLIDVLVELDTDGTGTISKEEFSVFLDIPRAVSALEQLGVDVPNLLLLVDILFDADSAPSSTPLAKSKTGNLEGAVGAMDSGENQTQASKPSENVELTFAEMLEMILRLRSENVASVPDIVDLRKFIRWGNNITNESMMDLKAKISGSKKELVKMSSTIHDKLDQMICEETRLLAQEVNKKADGVQKLEELQNSDPRVSLLSDPRVSRLLAQEVNKKAEGAQKLEELQNSDPLVSEGVLMEREALTPSRKTSSSPVQSPAILDKFTKSPNDMHQDLGEASKTPCEQSGSVPTGKMQEELGEITLQESCSGDPFELLEVMGERDAAREESKPNASISRVEYLEI